MAGVRVGKGRLYVGRRQDAIVYGVQMSLMV